GQLPADQVQVLLGQWAPPQARVLPAVRDAARRRPAGGDDHRRRGRFSPGHEDHLLGLPHRRREGCMVPARLSAALLGAVMRLGVAFLAAAVTVAPRVATADDADLIPKGVLDETAETAKPPPSADSEAPTGSRFQSKLFLEDAFTLSAHDDVVVSYPSSQASERQNRTSFDAHLEWKPLESLSFTLSDRLNLSFQDQQSFISRDT